MLGNSLGIILIGLVTYEPDNWRTLLNTEEGDVSLRNVGI